MFAIALLAKLTKTKTKEHIKKILIFSKNKDCTNKMICSNKESYYLMVSKGIITHFPQTTIGQTPIEEIH